MFGEKIAIFLFGIGCTESKFCMVCTCIFAQTLNYNNNNTSVYVSWVGIPSDNNGLRAYKTVIILLLYAEKI